MSVYSRARDPRVPEHVWNELMSMLENIARPAQSDFLVCAVLTYNTPDGGAGYVTGVNNEPCVIAGSLCAERAALCALRQAKDYDGKGLTGMCTAAAEALKVHPPVCRRGLGMGYVPCLCCWLSSGVYITTSVDAPITPGPLCREFLSDKTSPSTPVALIGATEVQVYPLGQLLPCHSVFAGLPAPKAHGASAAAAGSAPAQRITTEQWQAVLSAGGVDSPSVGLCDSVAAAAAAAVDVAGQSVSSCDTFHAVKHAAAVVFEDHTWIASRTVTAVEYGCTVDAITKLGSAMELKAGRATVTASAAPEFTSAKPLVVLLVDQWGCLHAPHAQARSYLLENEMHDVLCVAHQHTDAFLPEGAAKCELASDSAAVVCPVRALLPVMPDITFAQQ